MIAALTLGPHWPTTHNLVKDWLDIVERRRREFLVGGNLTAAVFYALRLSGAPTGLGVGVLVHAYFGFFWIFLLAGYARAHIKSGGPWLAYENEAVYPFYILHQTFLVVFGYGLVQQPWSIAVKLAIAMAVAFFGSWAGFELIRCSSFTRQLFGLR
ncbi:MAG: hypothetical protein FJW31_19240 [Acidobacteria bacterium]|nr:hypothetical protein [Acidobacteriota bacterium]